jgi:MFS family permease
VTVPLAYAGGSERVESATRSRTVTRISGARSPHELAPLTDLRARNIRETFRCKLGYLTASTEIPFPARHNPPWLFGVLVLPYGFTSSVTVLLMPYLLRKYGVAVDHIANIMAIAILPTIWTFLWSPLADCGFRRRTWVIISAVGAALTAAAAILGIHGSAAVLTALLFLTNALTGLLSSSCGALLTAMPKSLRGRSAGWYQTGNVGAGAVGGGLVIWLADRASPPVVAAAVVLAMVLPALSAFLIDEPVPERRAIGAQMTALFTDLRGVFSSRRTWLGLVFFLSPVGTAAVGNLISGVGQDYRASGNEVAWVTGIVGGLLTAAGCYIGGLLADRMNRMVAYALAGAVTAVFGAYLALAPASPFTFGAGYLGYSVATGLAYAVYTALLLDVVGKGRRAAASAYSTLNATGNASIVYMVWLDGVGYKRWGVRGLMSTDAVANGGFAVVLLLVAAYAGHHWHHRGNEAALPEEA